MVTTSLPTRLVSSPGHAKSQFEANGVVLIPQVIPEEEIKAIRQKFTDQVEKSTDLGHNDGLPSDDILSRYPRFVHPHRHPETEVGQIARKMMLDPRILKITEELIGPAYGAQSMFYFKPPTARGQSFHQDNNSLRCKPDTCLAAWIAMDDCNSDNGALMVIPGTHKSEIMCHDQPASFENSFSSTQIRLPPGLTPVQTEMRAGDVLFFNGSLVHGSDRNKTNDQFRRSLIFHYIPQSAKEIADFYHPLLTPEGEEIRIEKAELGGPCGEAWTSET